VDNISAIEREFVERHSKEWVERLHGGKPVEEMKMACRDRVQ
jgi:hypothetical protein